MMRRAEGGITACQRRWRFLMALQDPITLDRIRARKRFLYVGEDGSEMYFDADVLASFILTSGDYRNPLTRKMFHPIEISRLARISGMPEILDTDAAKRKRDLEMERNSLRDFFLGELASDLEPVFEYRRFGFPLSMLVRNMVSQSFPSIVVNVVRIYRSDPDFLGEYFNAMFRILDSFQEQATEEGEGRFAMAVQIYQQFCRDLQTRCAEGNLVTGHLATLSLGGLRIVVDVNTLA